MNADQITEKRAIERQMAEFVLCHKYKGTPEEQAEFLKGFAFETAKDLFDALKQWKEAEVRAAKARGEMHEDEYPVDDDKEALISLARGIKSLLRGDRHDMLGALKFATDVLNRTPVNIDTDDETWLEENGMYI